MDFRRPREGSSIQEVKGCLLLACCRDVVVYGEALIENFIFADGGLFFSKRDPLYVIQTASN